MKRLLILCVIMALSISIFAQEDEELVVVFGWEQEAQNLQPLNGLTYSILLENFYARDLWSWDRERNIYPIMAQEIPSIENGLVEITEEGDTAVTVQLREGMMWSDGTPITSADCEVWHRIRSDRSTSPSATRNAYPDVIKDFVIVDELTFTTIYNGAFPDYLGAPERPACRYPGHIFGPMIEDGGILDESPYFVAQEEVVGYGPYKLVTWNIGENMIFEKNEYWDLEEPAIDRVIIQFIPDDTQMRNALETGEIDISLGWSDDLDEFYSGIEGVETFSTVSVNNDALWVRSGPLGNDPEHGGDALNDVRVRKAIAHALDRLTFAAAIVHPDVTVPTTWYPPNMWPEDLEYDEYDLELANQLLDEAGWIDTDGDGIRDKDGVPLAGLRLITTENTVRNNYQLVIQEALAEVGIGVEIQIIPAGVMFASFADRGTMATYEYEMAIYFQQNLPLSPFTTPTRFGCGFYPSAENPTYANNMQFCDPAWDEANQKILETFPGEERDGYIHDAVRAFKEGYFWIGLRNRPTWYAIDTTLLDVASIQENIGTLDNNWFAQVEYWQPAS